MKIDGLDKIQKLSDNTDLENNVTGLEMIHSQEGELKIKGLDNVRHVFANEFPRMSPFTMEVLRLAGRARQLDLRFKQHGSQKHRYEFAPVATLSEVRDFEQRHSISLPASYVEFLTQVGNGGAGPEFGLYSLEELEFNNFIAHSDRVIPYPMIRIQPDFKTFSFSGASYTFVNRSLTPEKWDRMTVSILRLKNEGQTESYEDGRRAVYSGILHIADCSEHYRPALVCSGDMAGEIVEFSPELDMPRFTDKTFEEWILGYFEDVIAKFGKA